MLRQNWRPGQAPEDTAGQAGSGLVHVIDDDADVLQGVALMLRAARVSAMCHNSAASFLHHLDFHGADTVCCLLTDLRMPDMDGLALLRALAARQADFSCIVMSGHGDIATAVSAIKAGAADFIEKPLDERQLIAMLQHYGGRRMPHQAPHAAAMGGDITLEAAARVASLTPRESQVLNLLMLGRSNKAIARDLGLSPRTVEVHRAHLMGRLGATSLAEAVRLAMLASRAPG